VNESQFIADSAKEARALMALSENLLELPEASLDAKSRALAGKLLEQAKTTEKRATSPVNIGVVGKFNSGKSLLLGALMGYADGLPVDKVPTTGNITALHFSQQEGLATTQLRSFTIEYLNRNEAEACLSEMLKQVRKSAGTALRADLIERLNRFDAKDQNSLSGLDSWCASAWATSDDPSVRSDLRELVAFARACFRCGEGIFNAPEYKVEPSVARDGLTLPPPKELKSLDYSDLPAPPPAITIPPDPQEMNAALIQATFPLIRRLRVDVAVSAEIWNLTGLTGEHQFVLLDFPGLGSAFSGMRDRYLFEREMKDVQTILIVVNSDRAGEKAWEGLLEPMKASRPNLDDSVLVALGRFDKLELNNDGEHKLKELGATAPEGERPSRDRLEDIEDDDPRPAPAPSPMAVTEELVKKALPVLDGILNVAEHLVPETRKHRIVPVSPMLYFHLMREKQPMIQVGGPDFLEDLDADAQQGLRVRPLWEALARKLDDARPRRPDEFGGLAQWLGDFAADGGISRLRKLIGSHVQLHGLTLLARDVAVERDKLRRAHKELCDVIVPRGSSVDVRLPPERVEAVRKAFDELRQVYRDLIRDVNREDILVVGRDGKTVPVTKAVDEETKAQISEWPHWVTLFQASEDGYISEKTGSDAGLGSIEDPIDADDLEDVDDGEEVGGVVEFSGTGFPTSSADFYLAFEATLAHLERFTEKQIQAGLDFWLAELTSKMAGLREELGPLLGTKGLASRIRKLKLGDDAKGLLIWLTAAIEPTKLKEFIETERIPANDPGQPGKADHQRVLDPKALFPLSRMEGDHGPVRIFGWDRDLQGHPDPSCRPLRNLSHVCQVIRIREEFVRVLSEEMAQTVSLAVNRLNSRLVKVLTVVNTRIAKVSGDDRLRETLLKAVHAREASVPEEDSAQALQQIASFRWASKD
jgi:hypothetical protein